MHTVHVEDLKDGHVLETLCSYTVGICLKYIELGLLRSCQL